MSNSHTLARRIMLLALPLVGACAVGHAEPNDASTVRAVPVQLANAEPGSGRSEVRVAGIVAGKEEVTLSFKTGGVVSRVTVQPGDIVHAGQILAELTPTEIDATVAQATEGREKAARDLTRARALFADSVATLEQLQNATTVLEIAEQSVRIARFNSAHSAIRAPTDGIVLRRVVEPSQLVGPGAKVLDVRSFQRGLVLRASLPDRDAVRVRRGDVATITLDAVPDRVLAGRVSQVGAAANPLTGTYDIEVALSDAPRTLASGLIGRAAIAVHGAVPAVTIPVEALVEADGDSAIVFVVPAGSDRAQRRHVTIAPEAGARVTVLAGLDRGERVVIGGATWLDHDTRVTIATPAGTRP